MTLSNKRWFHGSGVRIDEFKPEFLGLGVEANGSGFYFTDDLEQATGYCRHRKEADMEKPGGEDSPSVMEVEFDFDYEDLLPSNSDLTLSAEDAKKIMEIGYERSSDKEAFFMTLQNFAHYGTEDAEALMEIAAQDYSQYSDTLLRGLFAMANDLFQCEEGLFCLITKEVLGYSGVRVEPEGDGYPEHIIAWDSADIKVVSVHSFCVDTGVLTLSTQADSKEEKSLETSGLKL